MKKSSSKKEITGTVLRVAGPVVQAKLSAGINDLVRVGDARLLGEVIQIEQETLLQLIQ